MDPLQQEQHRQIGKIFWLGLQISFIFAIPAIIAVVAGKKIDAMYSTGKLATIIALAAAFIFSWVLFLAQYYRLNKKLKEVNRRIKENNHA